MRTAEQIAYRSVLSRDLRRRLGLESHCSIELAGVPQIPAEGQRYIALGLDPPEHVEALCDAAIAAAKAELARRRLAALADD